MQEKKDRNLLTESQASVGPGKEKILWPPALIQLVICRAKSSANDLVKERGIVSFRVAPRYNALRLSLQLFSRFVAT